MSSERKHVYDMKCDSCGITQQVKEKDEWAILAYGDFTYSISPYRSRDKILDLCPSCLKRVLQALGVNEDCKDCKKKKGLFK